MCGDLYGDRAACKSSDPGAVIEPPDGPAHMCSHDHGVELQRASRIAILRSRLDRAAGLVEAARVRARRRVHRLRDALAEDHVALRGRMSQMVRCDGGGRAQMHGAMTTRSRLETPGTQPQPLALQKLF